MLRWPPTRRRSSTGPHCRPLTATHQESAPAPGLIQVSMRLVMPVEDLPSNARVKAKAGPPWIGSSHHRQSSLAMASDMLRNASNALLFQGLHCHCFGSRRFLGYTKSSRPGRACDPDPAGWRQRDPGLPGVSEKARSLENATNSVQEWPSFLLGRLLNEESGGTRVAGKLWLKLGQA